MNRVFILVLSIVCFLVFGCVSIRQKQGTLLRNEDTVPKWVIDHERLEIFPSFSYVSQIGYGKTVQECKEKAAASISEYLCSSVESSESASYFYKELENSFTENKEIRSDTKISTENNLYKLEYTNPYYYADLGQYVCVAFINREQAFNFVKPKLEVVREQFPKAYYSALEKSSLLDKIRGIKTAQSVLPDFYEVYDFARTILPEKARVYEEIDLLARESILKLKELSGTVIRIEGTGDTELLENSGVIAELSNQLSNMGYVVTDSSESGCLAHVEVKALIKETRETFETYPELYIKIFEDGEVKVSYAKKLAKVAGFDKETVIRRTNIALTKEVKTSFVEEFFYKK